MFKQYIPARKKQKKLQMLEITKKQAFFFYFHCRPSRRVITIEKGTRKSFLDGYSKLFCITDNKMITLNITLGGWKNVFCLFVQCS